MNPMLTDEEFRFAFASATFHYAPKGHWENVEEERKAHPLVGRKAVVDGKILECTKADDYVVIFKISDSSEKIVRCNDLGRIKWLNN